MTFSGKKATSLLLLGDIAVFVISLFVTLFLRYGTGFSTDLFYAHLGPFTVLFLLWSLVFYMAGLYGKRVLLFKSELPATILRTQLFNITLAALFFFVAPQIGIAPKTNLLIYLIVSLVGIYIWRIMFFPRLATPAFREGAALIGSGPEMQELAREVNAHPRYPFEFRLTVHPEALGTNAASFARELDAKKISLVVLDVEHGTSAPLLPLIYDLSFIERKYQFADFHHVYEEVFDREPLSFLTYEWFLKSISPAAAGFYAVAKRTIDILGGLLMGLITLIILPFVYIAMRLEGPGPLFLRQERIGLLGSKMRAYKFRSMQYDNAASGEWTHEERQNRVTHVGSFLRKTSLDEFPQFINVLRGELSLVGPRNDIAGLGARLAEAIAYYNVRYIVKPGLTGWAQINQQYEQGNISPQSIEETKVRLAYDFYYIKHRSLALDIVIALRTIKRMLFRVSSL